MSNSLPIIDSAGSCGTTDRCVRSHAFGNSASATPPIRTAPEDAV